MPYITEDKRQVLDEAISELHRRIVDLELDGHGDDNNTQGNLNYTITRLLRMVYGESDAGNYQNVNDAIGLLECIKLEHYRTIAVPYEDQKRFENGDVEALKPNVFLAETVVEPVDFNN